MIRIYKIGFMWSDKSPVAHLHAFFHLANTSIKNIFLFRCDQIYATQFAFKIHYAPAIYTVSHPSGYKCESSLIPAPLNRHRHHLFEICRINRFIQNITRLDIIQSPVYSCCYHHETTYPAVFFQDIGHIPGTIHHHYIVNSFKIHVDHDRMHIVIISHSAHTSRISLPYTHVLLQQRAHYFLLTVHSNLQHISLQSCRSFRSCSSRITISSLGVTSSSITSISHMK